jgi:hypothetical protein
MCCEPVTRIEYDVLDNVVRAMLASPNDAYWARRLLDLVRDPMTATRLRPHLVVAVQQWAAHDPSYFVHERYLSEQLAVWAWSRELLEDLDAKLQLEDPSLTHLIMGRLWLAARRPPADMPEFYARAAAHLRKVEDRLRVGAWHEAMCEALSVADPAELATNAARILDLAPPLARDRALLAILRGAARAANWDLYDQHRRQYGALLPRSDDDTDSSVRTDSEITRLDGMRAEHQLIRPRASSPLPTKPLPSTRVRLRPSRPTLASAMPSLAQLFEATTVRPPSRPR